MRSCADAGGGVRPVVRRIGLAAALLACALMSAPVAVTAAAEPQGIAVLYKSLVAREASVRKKLDAATDKTPPAPVLAEVRDLVRAYENAWKDNRTSGYSDNALWQGAALSADAFWQFGEGADKTTALRLFELLTSRFRTSSLVAQVPAQVERLRKARPSPVRTLKAAAPTAPSPAPAPATLPTSSIRSIRREVLPEVLRVVFELEREAEFHDERLTDPDRVFVEFRQTLAGASLKDARLAYPDDVVRQIRVGRPQGDRTRVVLDLQGAARHSVYALYNPFRIVVDIERPSSSSGLRMAAAKPAPPARQPSLPANGPGATWTAAPATTRPVTASAADAKPAAAKVATRNTPDPIAPAPTAVATTPAAGNVEAPLAPSPVAALTTPNRTTGETSDATRSAAVTTTAAAATAGSTSATPIPAPGAASAAPSATATVSPVTPAPSPSAPKATTIAPPRTAGAPLAPTTANAGMAATPSPLPPSANSRGGFSLSRQLGLGIAKIVIDPGHGGHDPGAKVKGAEEADVVLDVALRLEKLLADEHGVEVVLTRRTDRFVALEERTALANRVGADLFLSIHANASTNPNARGIETYFLNFAATPEAEAIAARENAGSAKTMRNLPDIVRAIALNNKIDESRDFATLVQSSLVDQLRKSNRDARNLGVKQAPFMVLIGATMPSILAEISFITNRDEGSLLRTEKYRDQIAQALYAGVMRYQQSLKRVPAVAEQ